jgi:hypothetical protein
MGGAACQARDAGGLDEENAQHPILVDALADAQHSIKNKEKC